MIEVSASASCSSRPAGSCIATRPAGAARRRSSSGSSTTGSSPARRSGRMLLDANATVEWTPSFYSKRMDDWLRNMGDWNISRKRYFGLPLPFYPCDCGELNVIGSRAELQERATGGPRPAAGAAPALDRRGDGAAASPAAKTCGGSRRSATPGSTRESSRSRRSAGRTPSGSRAAMQRARPRGSPARTCPTTRTGSGGSRRTGSPRAASRSGCGSTRCSFMSVTLAGRSPYRRVLDVRARARRDRARDAQVDRECDRDERGDSSGWAPT